MPRRLQHGAASAQASTSGHTETLIYSWKSLIAAHIVNPSEVL